MIVLHGRGDSMRAFLNIKNELRLPNMNYLLLNGPRKYSTGFAWCAVNPKEGSPSVLQIRARLFALIAELKAEGWQTKDIFLMGHSQGCLVACDLVLNYPEPFGALVGVSGYIWFAKGWQQRAAKSGALTTPWLMTHGTRDRVIPPFEIRADIAKLMDGDVPVHYEEFRKGHDFDFEKEVPFIRRWISDVRLAR